MIYEFIVFILNYVFLRDYSNVRHFLVLTRSQFFIFFANVNDFNGDYDRDDLDDLDDRDDYDFFHLLFC